MAVVDSPLATMLALEAGMLAPTTLGVQSSRKATGWQAGLAGTRTAML